MSVITGVENERLLAYLSSYSDWSCCCCCGRQPWG